MPDCTLSNIRVTGISCAVPKQSATESDLAVAFGEKAARRLVSGTGVKERRIDPGLCTSDLCFAAAERLLDDLGWERDTINHLIFISQTADYVLPATACVLQGRLNLSTDCTAFDVNLGCSAYPYGLWLAGKLMEAGQRVLLLVGDNISMLVNADDRSTVPLFGDAGSATALEWSNEMGNSEISFLLGTDGSGYKNIIVEAGGCRLPTFKDPAQRHLFMNGAEVFGFAIQGVPPLVEKTLKYAGWKPENCDDIVFHQANGFMLKHLAEKLSVPLNKVPMCLENFGNTSSASIPLTLVTERRDELRQQIRNYLLVGFGVGWSWGAAALRLGKICVPELIELKSL